jgi:hypothetical protein
MPHMLRRGIHHTLDSGSQAPSARDGVCEEPEQYFSGVSPDPLTDSDPRS